MFAGHYAASFAVKSMEKRIPLWQLFVAAQFIDILWSLFILLGIEKATVSSIGHPGSPLNLYYMPFTHSLLGALCWSGVVYLLIRIRTAASGIQDRRIPLLLALTVFSHWIADLIMHVQDLPLFGNHFKVGFGVYRSQSASFIVEEVLLLIAMYFYVRTSTGQGFRGKYGIWLFAIFLTLLNAYGIFGPLPPNMQAVGVYNFTYYVLNAFLMYRLERRRIPKQPPIVVA